MNTLNKENIKEIKWHKRTQIVWDRVEESIVEGLTPDYVSSSGSAYYYLEDGIVRKSDHWGHAISNCSWYLRENNESVEGWFCSKRTDKNTYAFVSYKRVYHNVAQYIIAKDMQRRREVNLLREVKNNMKRRVAKKAIYDILEGKEVNGVKIMKRTAKSIMFRTPTGKKRVQAHRYYLIDLTIKDIAKIVGVDSVFFDWYEVKKIKEVIGY